MTAKELAERADARFGVSSVRLDGVLEVRFWMEKFEHWSLVEQTWHRLIDGALGSIEMVPVLVIGDRVWQQQVICYYLVAAVNRLGAVGATGRLFFPNNLIEHLTSISIIEQVSSDLAEKAKQL